MAATIGSTNAAELVARAKQAGMTEATFKSITGWTFAFAENTTWRRMADVEARLPKARPAAASGKADSRSRARGYVNASDERFWTRDADDDSTGGVWSSGSHA